jgi:hypothetical protein
VDCEKSKQRFPASSIRGFTDCEGIIEAVDGVGCWDIENKTTRLRSHFCYTVAEPSLSCVDLRNRRPLINEHNKFKECLICAQPYS